MGKTAGPELRAYMDKKLHLQLNANRSIVGVLRGYDAFMNLHLAEAHEEIGEGEYEPLGVVVVRGNSIVALEALEPIDA
ncbi:hypothetical protein H4S06_004787 [Coemansia sp. BCRC 34490]|nr:hypothetical protein LPJ72_001886 [Coemansia sp. Benny D160-2]KAJ2511718.1 hypothetical protein GGI11_005000 [Coemansia sp. RSA 2049]KAJ2516539.1 hypothetical protein H4217_004522 [Coemansia sp. RSA 1939]KAJ2607211.1 hypothetical protein EV177_005642 [Coemansia sp. RSA 1804]KAJ2683189.1 hypothetical protein GGH99_004454 [Coemansia sp. RSA 1285]KAJ2748940.1 hypothetical protein H4S06_004787 [Coemansia sp. BCRC 34490]